jgi:hypothetical protein
MPTLDLRKDCLTQPTAIDLAVLGAMMIWPNSKFKRDTWIRSAMLHMLHNHVDTLPEAVVRRIAKAAITTPEFTDLTDKIGHRHGRVAGILLAQAVSNHLQSGGIINLHEIKTAIEQRALALRSGGLKEHTIDNTIWPNFKSVAPYWAAYIAGAMNDRPEWPCSLDGLAVFLATADAFRKAGEVSNRSKDQYCSRTSPSAYLRTSPSQSSH